MYACWQRDKSEFDVGTCVSLYIGLDCKNVTYRVKQVIVATDAGLFFTISDLRPEREEQNPNTGQPHEDTPVKKGGREERK